MKKEHEHHYQPAHQDSSLYGDVRSEVRDYGTTQARWDDYILLFCIRCGDTKKIWVREMKPS